MTRLLNILNQGNGDLQFEKNVVERRAEMASQCECLAAWVDGRECICNKTVDLPLSTQNLKKAYGIVEAIANCDARLAKVAAIPGDNVPCSVEIDDSRRRHLNGSTIFYEDSEGQLYGAPKVTLPKAVLLAGLRDERLKLMIELQKTGIVSVSRDNIKVLPK